MRCEYCGVQEAKLTINRIEEGALHQVRLCVACAANYEKTEMDSLFSDTAMLHQMMELVEDSALKIEHIVALRCPKCGMTYGNYKRSGKLGCALCYTSFEDKLLEYIRRYQGSDQHVGHHPQILNQNPHLEIEVLEAALRSAVGAERFEEAAVLRDQIKVLESRG